MQCSKLVTVNQIIVSHRQLSNTNNSYNNIRIETLNGCKLNLSQHSFLYNAEGGRGTGCRLKIKEGRFKGQEVIRYDFDLDTVHIPPLTSMTTRIDEWVPFPPFLKIEIVPEVMQGNIYRESGKVELRLKSKFLVSMGSSYKAPPLLVDMILTTEELKGGLTKSTRGRRLGKDGKCKLVGVARVDPVDDNYINFVLGLPSQCVGSLKAIISFF